MAFFEFNGENSPVARDLRQGLDMVDQGIERLKRARAALNGMTNAQITSQLTMQAVAAGNTADQQSAAIKAEVDSAVGKLTAGGDDVTATQLRAALDQLLAET